MARLTTYKITRAEFELIDPVDRDETGIYFVKNSDNNVDIYLVEQISRIWRKVKDPLDDVVKLTGSQSVSGVKTFTTLPESNIVPTLGDQLTNKTYVDSKITLPSQTGNSGKALFTDGTNASWEDINAPSYPYFVYLNNYDTQSINFALASSDIEMYSNTNGSKHLYGFTHDIGANSIGSNMGFHSFTYSVTVEPTADDGGGYEGSLSFMITADNVSIPESVSQIELTANGHPKTVTKTFGCSTQSGKSLRLKVVKDSGDTKLMDVSNVSILIKTLIDPTP